MGRVDRVARLAALALIVASLLPFGARLGWAFDLATHFRVQYVVAGVLLALLLAARRGFGWAAMLLACAALSAVPVWPYIARSPVASAAPPGPTIKLLAANVLFSNHSPQRLLEIVRRESPDVVLLVEYTPEWSSKVGELRAAYPYRLEGPGTGAFGIALFSRFELAAAKPFALGRTTALDARLRTPGGEVTLIGVHLLSPMTPGRGAQRNRQLDALADRVAAARAPVVVMGDLNITPYSPIYTDWLARTGLTDTRAGRTLSPSWPAFLPILGIPIDHCVVSRDISVVAHRGLPAFGSDHYPILAELALPPPRVSGYN